MGEDKLTVSIGERLHRLVGDKANHTDPDGPNKGWAAADVDPDEYTGDDYAGQFPEVSSGGAQ
jgi:hypothetical protein